MPRHKLSIHMFAVRRGDGRILTYCGRAAREFSLAIVDDEDGVTCSRCAYFMAEEKKALRHVRRLAKRENP